MQLIIPAYNEAVRLPRTLTTLRRRLTHVPVAGGLEVIVVDNASTDETVSVAHAASSAAMPVRVLSCSTRGKGAAVRAGIAETSDPVVGFMDADCATDLDALGVALRLIGEGADVAVGSRGLEESVLTERHSRLRELGARSYRGLARRVVPGVGDTQCGFKVMRGDLARTVFAATRCDGFSFDVEMLGRALGSGARLVEFPVTWVDVPGSSFSPARHGLDSFASLAAIAWRLRRNARLATITELAVEPADSPAVSVIGPLAVAQA